MQYGDIASEVTNVSSSRDLTRIPDDAIGNLEHY